MTDPSQYRPFSPAPRAEVTATSKGAWDVMMTGAERLETRG